MGNYEGPSWLYKIHDNLSPQKLIRVSGYFSHNYRWSNSSNVCADLPRLQAHRQQNVMVILSHLSRALGREVCWEPFHPPVAHDNKVLLHMWFSIGCWGSAQVSSRYRTSFSLKACFPKKNLSKPLFFFFSPCYWKNRNSSRFWLTMFTLDEIKEENYW